MPRISSVKKKNAKKPSKNFFENRESVALEDDTSVYEKSAELAKKIQDDKQKEINEAVKKATKKTSEDSSLKKNVDDIIKKMVSDADRKQVSYDKFRNDSITTPKETSPKLRNSSVTDYQVDNVNLRNRSVTNSVTDTFELHNNSVTDNPSAINSHSKKETISLTKNDEIKKVDKVTNNLPSDNPADKKTTSEISLEKNITANSELDKNAFRNSSVTDQNINNKDIHNSSVTDIHAENQSIRNNTVTDTETPSNRFHNSSVTNINNSVTNSVTASSKLRNDSVTIHNKPVTDSVTASSELRNSSVTGSVTNNVTINKDFYSLVGVSKKIVFHIGELCYKTGSRITPPITFSELKTQLDISSNEVVRVNIHRLIKKDIFRKVEHKTGKGGYQILEIREHVYKELVDIITRNSVTSSVTEYSAFRNNSITDSVTDSVTNHPSSSISFNNINNKLTTMDPSFNPAEVPGQQQLGPQFDNDWQNIDISPLQSIGFTNHHLSQLFTKNMLSPKQVQDSINAFAFDLYENKRGEKIKTSPLNLFMGILKGGNEYNPPKNYESEEDRILREQVEAEREKLEKRQQMQSELKELKYKNWLLDLSVEKKLQLLDIPLNFFEKMPVEAIESGLKKHFEMKVL